MGFLRKSIDEKVALWSAMFGFSDMPLFGKVLIDDIAETVMTKSETQGFEEIYSFDEYEKKLLYEKSKNQ